MARPTKQGVDYFPLDVHLDNKFKFVEIKYGIEGFGIVVKIMQNIYSQGYWAQWGEDEQLLFAGEHRIDYDKLVDVTNECIKRGVFNKDLYEKHEILTSNGIQKRYKEIVRRRKEVEVIEEYLLIDGTSLVNDGNNSINDDAVPVESKHDDGKSTQRKGKETKEKKTKEQIPYVEIVKYLNEKSGRNFNPSSSGTQSLIKARWNEKNDIEAFKRVIDVCCHNWKGKTFSNGKKGDDYLQPSTLFNTKFDERLNWAKEAKSDPVKQNTYRPDSVDLGGEYFEPAAK